MKTPATRLRPFLPLLSTMALIAGASPAATAWELAGHQTISLQTREGPAIDIGTVDFQPRPDGSTAFTLHMDHDHMKDYFLSMKEFKCIDGPTEIMCHVPYPYAQPGTIVSTGVGAAATPDFAWLEHALLFMFKTPKDFGAKLWNGVYFKLKATDHGLEGSPQSVDLNHISAPPDRPGVPPYNKTLRDDIAPGTRWISGLVIR